MKQTEKTTFAGVGIIRAAWITNILMLCTSGPVALGFDGFIGIAVAVSAILFLVGIVLFVYALGIAIMRSARGENVEVGNLFLVQSQTPIAVKRQLFGALIASVVIAGLTVWAQPFSALIPMLPIALVGLWGARHGEFPAVDNR